MHKQFRHLVRVHHRLHDWGDALPTFGLIGRVRYWSLYRWFINEVSERYGGYIDPAAKIGDAVRWVHQFHGVFIAGTASIGDRCMFHHRVTLGATRDRADNVRAPQIGNDVFFGADVTLVGRCIVGDGAKIGAGVTLVDAEIAPEEVVINKSAYSLTRKAFIYPQD